MDTGEIHDDWREAHIVSLFKKGDKHQASDYRSVSLPSVACKKLEHTVQSNVINHFLENDILVIANTDLGQNAPVRHRISQPFRELPVSYKQISYLIS